jgi:hypothetical protein
MHALPLSDAELADELARIGARLAALASEGGDTDTVAAELGAIRAQLRLLAEQNLEVRARLAVSLGLESPPAQG